jgi:hypothetical protein
MCVGPCLSESAKNFAEEPFALQLSDKALQDVTLAYNSLASGLFFLSICALESTPSSGHIRSSACEAVSRAVKLPQEPQREDSFP